MEIIPAIDIIDGKCVRLSQGDFEKRKTYNEKPLEVALKFQDAGLMRLHLVDLDGARLGQVSNWKVLETIAGKTNLVVDFGGGIKTKKDVTIVFDSGAAFATVGSVAVKNENELSAWFEEFGIRKFMLGADVKNEKIAVNGWTETTSVWVYDFLEKYIAKGIQQVFCTDVSKDGLLDGPAVSLYESILKKFQDLKLIASGGVSSLEDLDDLQRVGCSGVIIGKAIYEGRISLSELSRYISQNI